MKWDGYTFFCLDVHIRCFSLAWNAAIIFRFHRSFRLSLAFIIFWPAPLMFRINSLCILIAHRSRLSVRILSNSNLSHFLAMKSVKVCQYILYDCGAKYACSDLFSDAVVCGNAALLLLWLNIRLLFVDWYVVPILDDVFVFVLDVDVACRIRATCCGVCKWKDGGAWWDAWWGDINSMMYNAYNCAGIINNQ